MKVFMEMKLFLVCVSLNVLKDSETDVGTERHKNARKEETVARLGKMVARDGLLAL